MSETLERLRQTSRKPGTCPKCGEPREVRVEMRLTEPAKFSETPPYLTSQSGTFCAACALGIFETLKLEMGRA